MVDPAIIGKMRVGYFRIGVLIPHWDELKEQLARQLPAKSIGGVDPALAGKFRAGHVRAGVIYPLYDELKESLKKIGNP